MYVSRNTNRWSSIRFQLGYRIHNSTLLIQLLSHSVNSPSSKISSCDSWKTFGRMLNGISVLLTKVLSCFTSTLPFSDVIKNYNTLFEVRVWQRRNGAVKSEGERRRFDDNFSTFVERVASFLIDFDCLYSSYFRSLLYISKQT